MRLSAGKLEFCGRLFMGTAACISLYLACAALGRVPLPGCESGSPCDSALQSPWAFLFGLPVSFPGFLLYALALQLSGAFVRRTGVLAGLQGGAALAAVVAAAIWFSALQVMTVHSLCLWCSLTHGFATGGAVLLCAARMRYPVAGGAKALRVKRASLSGARFLVAGTALACVGLLAAGTWSSALNRQGTTPAPGLQFSIAAEPAPVPKGLAVCGGKFHVNPEDFPVLGHEAPASRTVILLSDYTSSLCRQYQSAIETSMPAGEDPVQVIVLPAALTPDAKEIQRVVLTLYHTDRKAWRSLSALITSGQIPAEPAAVQRVARKLAGAQKWTGAQEANEERVEQLIELAASLLEETHGDAGSIPVLISGSRTLLPSAPDMNELLAFLNAGAPQTSATAQSKGTPAMSPPEAETVPGLPSGF
jgi:uncharacterized membrane protein